MLLINILLLLLLLLLLLVIQIIKQIIIIIIIVVVAFSSALVPGLAVPARGRVLGTGPDGEREGRHGERGGSASLASTSTWPSVETRAAVHAFTEATDRSGNLRRIGPEPHP